MRFDGSYLPSACWFKRNFSALSLHRYPGLVLTDSSLAYHVGQLPVVASSIVYPGLSWQSDV